MFSSPAPQDESHAKTDAQHQEIKSDGSYAYDFHTSNNIESDVKADSLNKVTGQYSYKDPSGRDIKVSYIAGEGIGFMPLEGVDPEIIKAVQYIVKLGRESEIEVVPEQSE